MRDSRSRRAWCRSLPWRFQHGRGLAISRRSCGCGDCSWTRHRTDRAAFLLADTETHLPMTLPVAAPTAGVGAHLLGADLRAALGAAGLLAKTGNPWPAAPWVAAHSVEVVRALSVAVTLCMRTGCGPGRLPCWHSCLPAGSGLESWLPCTTRRAAEWPRSSTGYLSGWSPRVRTWCSVSRLTWSGGCGPLVRAGWSAPSSRHLTRPQVLPSGVPPALLAPSRRPLSLLSLTRSLAAQSAVPWPLLAPTRQPQGRRSLTRQLQGRRRRPCPRRTRGRPLRRFQTGPVMARPLLMP